MERLHEVIAIRQRQKGIVQVDFGDPGQGAQNNVLDAGLSGGSHRDGIAIAAQASSNPENFDLGGR